LRGPYPEVAKNTDNIAGIIQKVQKAYLVTRNERIPELLEKFQELKRANLQEDAFSGRLGKLFFDYKDTYGLAIPTIQNIMGKKIEQAQLTGRVLEQAWREYDRQMIQQQDRSRAASKMAGDVFVDTITPLDVPKTEFIGYDHMSGEGGILKLFIHDREVREVSEEDEVKVILDRTPFYAEAGGQIGDSGFLNGANGRIRITDTQKVSDIYLHSGRVETGRFSVNERVAAVVDEGRRLSIMRNHTATHLLQAALRKVLGAHVQQQGSLVDQDRLRFDFTHPQAVNREQKSAIEDFVNAAILACDGVEKKVMSLEEAKNSGALAFFAEKYGSTVRVVSINGYSKEFCGGTHLRSTGQIGLFKIISESAIAQGIRRIEAQTGLGALAMAHEQEKQLTQIAQILKAPVTEVVDRLNTQAARLKELEKKIEYYRFEALKVKFEEILAEARSQKGSKIITYIFPDAEMEFLRKISDFLKPRVESGVLILGGSSTESAYVLVAVSKDLIGFGLKADEIIRDIAPLIQGSGGGRPHLAQAGSKDGRNLEQALRRAKELVITKLEGIP
jgi:alanyl-tRNA synthetase